MSRHFASPGLAHRSMQRNSIVLSAAKVTPRRKTSRLWAYFMAGAAGVCWAVLIGLVGLVLYAFGGM